MLLAPGPERLATSAAEFQRRLQRHPASGDDASPALTAGADTLFERRAPASFTDGPAGRARRLVCGCIWLVALLFMVLPAINLVNINLSRILERASEIGVRKAFGATSRALVGSSSSRTCVLTLLRGRRSAARPGRGGRCAGSTPAASSPTPTSRSTCGVLGWGVLLPSSSASSRASIPAWRMSRLHPVEALRGRSE